MLSSNDKDIEVPLYDAHGNTTRLGSTWDGGTTVTEFGYDSSDRNSFIKQNWGAQKVDYNRDAQNRVVMRWLTTWDVQTDAQWYGHTSSGDTPDYARRSDWTIAEKYFQLPGGVIMTVRPTETDSSKQKVFSLPNIHGDVMTTTDANCAKQPTICMIHSGNLSAPTYR